MSETHDAHVRAATEADDEALLRLLSTVWPDQDNEAFLKTDPGYQTRQTRVVEAEGSVVSCLQVYDRRLRLGDGTVRVGCVANVATHRDHRRRGYATRLLRDADEFMQNEGYEAGMLFADIPGLYERLGWQVVRQSNALVQLRPTAEMPSPAGWQVRQGDWGRDLPALMRIYDAYNSGRTGTVVRSEEYWIKHRLKLTEEDPKGFLVAERDGQIGAYARCRSRSNVVMEVGGEPNGLCRVLREVARRRGRTLVLHMPRDAETESLLTDIADRVTWYVPPVETPHIDYIMMRPVGDMDIDVFDGLLFHHSDHF